MERGEGDYFTGSMLFNLIAVETLFAVGVVGSILMTWPTPPWRSIFYTGIVFMTVAPFGFFPFSKTLWLALDLAVRPHGDAPSDLESSDDAVDQIDGI